MTVTTTSSRISYVGDGTSVTFPFPYYFLAATDIEVFLNFVSQGSGFTVSGAGNEQGGSVTFNTPPAAGVPILLVRVPDLLQETDLPPNDPFPSEAVEKALDKLTMIAQELSDNQGRSVRFPLSETVDGTLPVAGQRASTVYGFDASGIPTLLPMPASVGAGDLRDEIGSDGKPGFVAGTDFTAGVTTTFALSRAPGSKANVSLHFDAAYQGGDQISLIVGNVVTLTSPVPLGTQRVYFRTGTTLSLGQPAQGSVSTDSLADHAVTDAKISTTSKLYDRIANIFDVKDYGAQGTGTDDTAAFVAGAAAVSARGGGTLYAPPGFYGIAPGGFACPSNVTILGAGCGATVLKPLGNLTAGAISIASKTNVHFEGITFDGVNSTSNIPVVTFNTSDRFSVRHCEFLNFGVFGLSINGGTNFKVEDNYFSFPVPKNTQNQALNISVSGGSVINGVIARNVMLGSAMDVAGSYLQIKDNYINSWKFGAGITVEVGSTQLLIDGNVCTGGTGNDINSTVCLGIECWATRSTISNNICASNDGDGIDNGGQWNVITGNLCFNNGAYSGGGNGSGIVTRYTDATQNGNNSIVVGNICFDTNGGSGTQSYGYADQNSNVARVTLRGNWFNQNRTAPTNIQGSAMDVDTPILFGSAGFTPGTIANGSSAGGGISVPGARFGDTVEVSWSNDQQGNKLFGWVSSNDTVSFRFENNTGGSSTFGAGTVRARVKKQVNYAAY